MGMAVIKKIGFTLSKHAPEILTGTGLVTMIGGTVFACKQTPKAMAINNLTEKHLQQIEDIHKEAGQNGGKVNRSVKKEDGSTALAVVEYTDKDYANDVRIEKVKGVKELAKTYAIPAVMLLGGSAMILGGHGILRKRNATAIATIGSLLTTANEYRQRVRNQLGDEADRKFLFGEVPEAIKELVNPETGEITTEVAPTRGFVSMNEEDPRFLFFNKENCPDLYKGHLMTDLTTIHSIQDNANDILVRSGHLTVNDARDLFGAKAIPEGLDNGWVLDNENGDGRVDFGLFDPLTGEPKSWVFGDVDEDQGIPIEFNIDGNIKGLLCRPRNAKSWSNN